MDHTDHVNLLRPANLHAGGTWADFGAGSGAFTLALRELIGPEATIYAVDKDRGALNRLESAYRSRFHSTDHLTPLNQDFSHPLDLPALDGIVATNSLHYFRDTEKILRHVREFLKPNGALLIVEYNVDSGKYLGAASLLIRNLSLPRRAGWVQRAAFTEDNSIELFARVLFGIGIQK
ncbi:MAG TPA: class I SAM-dependent methyltransferase [Anaerolineales bacterium]|nr:class I SAM-dependent methyltransferase [Anaerolineales bacterium]